MVQFLFYISWEQRKAETLFISYVEKGFPALPVLSATQDKGMVYRDDAGKIVVHDKNNEIGYKRVQPGQFVIHLRSFQGGFAHSNILGITSPAYTIFGFKEGEKQYDLFWKCVFSSPNFIKRLESVTYGIRDGRSISYDEFLTMKFIIPEYKEQVKIATCLIRTDNLITLHQCEYFLCSYKYVYLHLQQSISKKTNSWEQRKLGEVTQYATSSLKIADCTDEGEFDLYDANSVIGKTNFNVQTEDYITIIKDGSGVGTVRLLPKNTSFIGTMGAILAKNSEIEFIYALLQRFDFSQHINGATIPHVYYSEYKQDIIYAPIRNEQRIIGKIFKQLDNLITLHQCKHFILFNNFLSHLVSFGKCKKTNSWEQRKLGDTIDFYSGLTYSPSDIVKDDGVFVLRSCNVQEGEIVDDDNVYVRAGAVNSDNVSVDDIIVVVRNGSRSLIGKHAKIKKNMPKTVIGAFMTGLRYKNSAYLNAVLNTSIFAREIEKDLGATINQITTGAFRKMVFPFPKQPEQSLIGNFFEQLDNLITLHQRKLKDFYGGFL